MSLNQDDFSELDEQPDFSWRDYRFEDAIALFVFTVLALTVFSQFFSRYVLGSSLGWTEEVARYLLVCVGFLGACMAMRKNTHIAVTLFTRMLPEKMQKHVASGVAVLNIVFLICLIVFAIQIIPRIHIYEMASLPLPLSVLYSIVLVSLVLMLVRGITFLLGLRNAK